MEFINGFTLGLLDRKYKFSLDMGKESLRILKLRTNSSYVVLAIPAWQDTPQSTDIFYNNKYSVNDEELLNIIGYAKKIGLKVILKPLLNCKDGTWRAHINFFDIEAKCEPKWSDWFKSYNEFILHYAKIAQDTNSEMLIIGCEMVQTERKECYWRELIKNVKVVYNGLVSYNTDKYQENNVKWWDAVDVISSSGYYPINDWGNQLDRIEKIIKPYGKPFFFAEAGCASTTGASIEPNNWSIKGKVNLEEQALYYQTMFRETNKRQWIKGFGLWDWKAELYDENKASIDDGYEVFGKPAEKVIFEYYSKVK
jgi:hypothetical protein